MTNTSQDNSDQNAPKKPVNGSFKIRLSDDQLAAYLSDLNFPSHGGEAVTMDMVMAELKSQKITVGIDEDKIRTLLSASTSHTSEDELCIARGIAAVKGEDDELVWHLSEHYLQQGCAVVLPDDLIATYRDATKGQPGKTVQGKEISACHGANHKPQIGTGIKTNKIETGDEYRAAIMGCVISELDNASIIQVKSLLHIADDGMEAHMDIYAQTANGEDISFEHVMTELANNKISHGIDQDLIQSSLRKALHVSSDKPIACIKEAGIAHGTPAKPGKDASLIISREENVVGAELSHGYIDFHELGYPWNVNKGERVGYLRDARPGIEGSTIHGTTIKVNKPKEIKCKLDGLHKDDKGRLIADLDGALIINGNSLSVVDLLVINGDVGPKTGNIHSKIPVHVKGHVEPGFILESEKEVIVDKNIENATVRSGSSILIKGGIRGMKSRVYSPSDVTVAFVETASIYLNGRLIVNGSIINSIVASNNAVIVGDQKVKHSMVVGGELTAHDYLEVSELGSDAYFKTIVRLGIAQEERRKIILLDKEIDEINNDLLHIKQLEYNHRMTPKADTSEVVPKLAIARKSLLEKHSLLEDKKNAILEQLKQSDSTRIVVKKCVYPGVIIFINDRYHKVNTRLGAGSFVFDKENDSVIFVPE